MLAWNFYFVNIGGHNTHFTKILIHSGCNEKRKCDIIRDIQKQSEGFGTKSEISSYLEKRCDEPVEVSFFGWWVAAKEKIADLYGPKRTEAVESTEDSE